MKRTLQYKCQTLFFALLCIPFSSGDAAEPDSLQTQTNNAVVSQLAELTTAEHYQEAFNLAQKHAYDLAGEARFDFLLGVSALRVGEYHHALFAFERAVINQPDWEAARYNLATAYFQVEKIEASKSEFGKLLSNSENDSIVAASKHYISMIDRVMAANRKTISQVASVGIGRDSNINSGVTIDSFEIPLLSQPIRLSDSSKAQSDAALKLNYQFNHQYRLNQRRDWVQSLALAHTEYLDDEHRDFESSMVQFSSRITDTLGSIPVSAGLYFRPIFLGGEAYRDHLGINSEIGYAINSQYELKALFDFNRTEYRNNAAQDANEGLLKLELFFGKNRWTQGWGTQFGLVDTITAGFEYNAYRLTEIHYQAGYQLDARTQIQLRVQRANFRYDATHSLFALQREDDLTGGSLGIQFYAQSKYVVQASLSYTEKDSNIPVNSFRRTDLSFSVVKPF